MVPPGIWSLSRARQMPQRTLAMVLAGGEGKRLAPLTADRAKPAVPFGGLYRIVDFTLSNCINSDLRQIVVLTQYKARSLDRHIRFGWGFLRERLNPFIHRFHRSRQIKAPVLKDSARAWSVRQGSGELLPGHWPDRQGGLSCDLGRSLP